MTDLPTWLVVLLVLCGMAMELYLRGVEGGWWERDEKSPDKGAWL